MFHAPLIFTLTRQEQFLHGIEIFPISHISLCRQLIVLGGGTQSKTYRSVDKYNQLAGLSPKASLPPSGKPSPWWRCCGQEYLVSCCCSDSTPIRFQENCDNSTISASNLQLNLSFHTDSSGKANRKSRITIFRVVISNRLKSYERLNAVA